VITKSLSTKDVKTLGEAMVKTEFKSGEIIIRYGDIGTEYFLLRSGEVEVLVYEPGTDPNDISLDLRVIFRKIMSDGAFGEMALLYGDKRSATVKA